MSTVLVPLDETGFAESILPDAQQLAGEHAITHVVMTSHGRTGLSRMIAGDVAADLIERLSLPIVVIPSLAELAPAPEERTVDDTASAPAGLPASRQRARRCV